MNRCKDCRHWVTAMIVAGHPSRGHPDACCHFSRFSKNGSWTPRNANATCDVDKFEQTTGRGQGHG